MAAVTHADAEKGVKQQEVLSVLDNAKVSLFHFKAIIVAGAGFFTDAYDLFSISLLTRILGRLYYQDSPLDYQDYVSPGSLPVNVDAAVSGVALCGTLAGQLVFGALGDKFGRKSVYGLVLSIMIISAIAQSMSFGTTGKAVIGTLCFFRFFLGFGVGGDYPLSATIMSEYSSRLSRGAFVSAVFAQQGTGILTAATVTIIVVSCFRAAFPAVSFPDRQLVLGAHPPISASITGTPSCPPYVYFNSANNRPEFGLATLDANMGVVYHGMDDVLRLYPNITFTGSQFLNDPTATWAPHVPYWTASHAATSSTDPTPNPAPVYASVPTFCDPVKYANHTVRCPFRLVNPDGSVFSKTQAGGQNFLNTANPGDTTYKYFSCINFIDYGGFTGGDSITDPGGVRVNEETGAPKVIDFPKLNPLSQAYYWNQIKQSVPLQCDWIWRVILLFGFFPAACTMYIRATFPETPRFTLHVEGDKAKLAKDMTDVVHTELSAEETKSAFTNKIPFSQFLRKHGKELLGCAMSWFLLDVAFYSQNLFQKDVFTQINWLPPAGAVNAMSETFKVARAQALISLGSTIPGYWFTVMTVDRMGRIKIQLMGFVVMTALMAALAGGYLQLLDRSKSFDFLPTNGVNGFVAIYALTFFFANWGPNATTFVIPAELFPTSWKSTGHGFSAAMGKAGAIIGAFGFLYASKPFIGEHSWQPNYGGAPNTAWIWKPNCPTGLGSKAWAGNIWDPVRKPLWGPCACHPNQKWISLPDGTATSTFNVLYPDLPNGNIAVFQNATKMAPYGYSYDASGNIVLADKSVTYDWLAANTGAFKYGAHLSYADNATIDSLSSTQMRFVYNASTVLPPLPHNFYSPQVQTPYSRAILNTPLGQCMPYGTGIRGALGILAGTNFLGMLFTFLLPETNGKTLEELSGEVDEQEGSPAGEHV